MNENARKKRILILAEGFEEKPYLDKVLSFPSLNRGVYDFCIYRKGILNL